MYKKNFFSTTAYLFLFVWFWGFQAHGMTFEFVPWNGTELWMEEGEGKGREGKG